MRFGLFIPQGWRHDLVGIEPADQWRVMNDLALAADAGPWESLWVYDHFHTVPVPSEEATHEAWTLMAAFAATTSRIRLGQMCTCIAYRNPAYLAKVAATVDIISGGRLEMGIGAGWYEHEWRAYGYGFPDAPTRLRMLREGVEIMRQAWTTGSATLDGEFYQVDGAIVRPLPLQEGGIPMWVAGGGEKVTLKIAAQYAQYTNFNGGPEVFAQKSELLRGHCDDGRHRLRRDRAQQQLQHDHRRDRSRGAEPHRPARGAVGDVDGRPEGGRVRGAVPRRQRRVPGRDPAADRRDARRSAASWGSATASTTSRSRRTTAPASSCSSARSCRAR